jgi:hypothetical protein
MFAGNKIDERKEHVKNNLENSCRFLENKTQFV